MARINSSLRNACRLVVPHDEGLIKELRLLLQRPLLLLHISMLVDENVFGATSW